MGKRVTHKTARRIEKRFGLDKDKCYVACDDGTTYVFVRPDGAPAWRPRMRISADGSRTLSPSRLPAHVAMHVGLDHRPFAFDPNEPGVAV